MTLSQNTVKEIVNLRRRGHSYKEIAKKLKLSPATSHKYSRHTNLSKDGKKRLYLKIRDIQLKFKKRYCKLKKINIKHKYLSIEKARILSHCLWDGAVSKNVVSYNNTSKNLIDEFKKDMLKVYDVLPDREHSLIREGIQELFILSYHSKIICNDLLKYSPSFSTKSNNSRIPEQILTNKNRDILKEFLRVLWEDEGSISCYNAIRVKIMGKHIRDQLIVLHKKFGIELTPYREKDDSYGIYIKNNLQNLKRFDEICFRKAHVTAGKNRGKLKYDVFSSLLSRLGNPNKL